MKMFSNDVENFNNLVFEKRNKEYGAYVIRSEYNATKIKSMLITLGVFLLAVGSLWFFSGGKEIVKENLVDLEQILSYKLMDVTPKEEKKLLADQPKSSAAMKGDLIGKVSNTAPEHDVKPNEHQDKAVNGVVEDPNANGNSKTDSVVREVPAIVHAAVTPVTTEVHKWAEKMPAFNGSVPAFLQKHIVYPETAIYRGTEGTVYVQFVVNETGSVSDVQVIKGIGDGCDEEAVRIIKKMNGWSPGEMNGKAVKVLFHIPIVFKLQRS